MSDYNNYVTAVNKIFEIIATLKKGWNDQDNINAIDEIEESKTTVVEVSKMFSNKISNNNNPKKAENLEELGD